MIVSLMSCLALTTLWLRPSEATTLCDNPAIDSIDYNKENSMWFFTSQGSYWYITDPFPTKKQGTKLPEGFTRGDAVAFYDRQTECGVSGEQNMILVEHTGSTNEVIEYDTNTNEFRDETRRKASDHPFLGPARVDWTKKVDAMFSVKTVIFIVQGDKYAAIDWKELCTKQDASPKATDAAQVEAAFSFSGQTIGAIAFKTSSLYVFYGQRFYIFNINVGSAKKGTISGNKDSITHGNKTADFFKTKICAAGDPQPDAGNAGQDKSPDDTDNEDKPDGGKPEDGVGWVLIVMGVVVVLVVAVVIGLLVFAVTKKSGKPSQAKATKKPAPKVPAAKK